MLKLQVIGNLGADAQLKVSNGNEFVTFRVAHTEKFEKNGGKVTNTTWVDVIWSGNGGQLLPYLKKGVKVFVDGYPSFRIYDSAQNHCKMVGISISARSIELCGGSNEQPLPDFADENGQVVEVRRVLHIVDNDFWNTVLIDKDMKRYNVDEIGNITGYATDEQKS